MPDNELLLKIKGDSSSAKAALDNLSKSLGGAKGAAGSMKETFLSSGATAEGSLSGLGASAMKFAGVLGVAFSARAVIDFVKESVTKFAEEQQALVALATVVNATGANWDDYTMATTKAMAAGEQLGFKGHETANALETLTLMTGNASKAYNALGLAQDLARAKGMDLASASSLIAKVEEGRIGIASRILPFLKAGMTAEQAIATIQERVAGSAEAYAKTTQGAIDKMTASWDAFQENLGGTVAPAVSSVLQGLTDDMTIYSRGTYAQMMALDAMRRQEFFGSNAANAETNAKVHALALTIASSTDTAAQATTGMVSLAFGTLGAAAAAVDAAGAFTAEKYALTYLEGQTNNLTDDVVNMHGAQKALHDYLAGKGKKDTAEYQQLLERLSGATGQVATDTSNMTKAEIQAAIKAGILKGKVSDYITVLNSVPPSVTTALSVKITGLPALQAFASTLMLIKGHATVTVTPPKKLPPKAAGDIMSPASGGQDVTVAENGYKETLINWAPANRARNAALMATTAAGIGLAQRYRSDALSMAPKVMDAIGLGGARSAVAAGDTYTYTYYVTVNADRASDRNQIYRGVESVVTGKARSARVLRMGAVPS
jgi:hypothetical protein